MRRLILLLVGALGLMTVACGSDTGDRAEPTPEGSVVWAGCGDDLQCATLTVPIDHDAADGPTLDLELAVRPAASGEQRVGVLLTNPGGPGASGIDALRSGLPLPTEVLDRFDVVSWDPRGVGGSTPLDCGPELGAFLALDPEPDSADRAELDRLAPVVARSCREASGAIIDHVATADHVRDMDAIRQAVGEATISYVGFSYGTRFGLGYLDRHPERVEAMVLDGVVRPDLTVGELLSTQARALEGIVEDLLDGQETMLEAVRREAAEDALAGAEGRLDPVRVDRALVLAGYDRGQADRFLDGLADAAAGDGEALDEQGLRYERLVDFPAYLATSCADGRGPVDEDGWDDLERRIEGFAPVVGAVVANELRPCAYWPGTVVEPAPATEPQPGAATPTVLLVNNTRDPATPVEWARSVAVDLPSATLEEIDGVGHIALDGSRCARDLARRTLIDRAVPDDADCP